MKKMEIEIAETSELSLNSIRVINKLKNQYWKHTEEEHLRWFKDNILSEDLHIQLFLDESLRAYLNMVHIDIVSDEKKYSVLGIGNVCVDKEVEHLGYGTLLVAAANAIIKKMKTGGLLLCHEELIHFYLKNGWKEKKYNDVRIKGIPFKYIVMAFDPYNILQTSNNSLEISRSF